MPTIRRVKGGMTLARSFQGRECRGEPFFSSRSATIESVQHFKQVPDVRCFGNVWKNPHSPRELRDLCVSAV